MKNIILLLILLSLFSCNNLTEKEAIAKYASKASQSKFISIDNKKVHYRESGSGEPLILIHGVVDSLHTWDLLVPFLETKYRVIRIDVPGFGLSDPLELKGNLPLRFSNFLKSFMGELNIQKASLIGNSLGGLLSWTFAVNYPNLVNKVVLLSSGGFPQKFPWVFDVTNTFVNKVIRTFGNETIGPLTGVVGPRVPGLVADTKHKDFVSDQFLRISELMTSQGNLKSYIDLLEYAGNYDYSDSKRASEIKHPMLILHGEKDQIIPVDTQIPQWKKSSPNSTIKILRNSAHMPHWEDPLRLSKLIAPFLAH